jgi:hypothetical protein
MRIGNRHLLLTFSSILCVTSIAHGQVQTKEPAATIPPMRQLYVEDQRDRGALLTDAGEAIKSAAGTKQPPAQPIVVSVLARDAERRKKVRALLAAGQVISALDFHDAAFIFQHGESPDDYLLAHILAIAAVVKGDSSSKWIAAATLDRYLQVIGQQQVFGTQYLDNSYLYFLQHHNDADLAEKIKAVSKGITQQPYNDQLIPDALRADFCVPELRRQTEAVEAANNSKDNSLVIPHGCAR